MLIPYAVKRITAGRFFIRALGYDLIFWFSYEFSTRES